MKHIRYLVDNRTVCEYPKGLDSFYSPVVPDYDNDLTIPSCGLCFSLLTAHNKRAYEAEQYENIKGYNTDTTTEDPLAPARGMMWGPLLGSAFWLIIGLLVWVVFFRG